MVQLFGKQVDIERINPEAVKPAPLGTSQYSGAQKYSGVGDNAKRLAASLASLSSSLTKYGAVASQDPSQQAIDDATDKMYGMTPEQRDEYQKSAEFLALDATIRHAGGSISGSASATEWAKQISAEFNSPDYDGTYDDKVADMLERRQAHMQTLGTDAERAAFWKGSQSFVDRFTAKDQATLIDNALQNRDDAIFSHIMGRTNDSLHDGLPAGEVAAYIISELESMPRYLKLTPFAQQTLLFKIAKAYAAEGRPELVEGLLYSDRGDVGPLIDLPTYKVDGMALIEAATKVRDKSNFDDTLPAWMDLVGKAKRGAAPDPVVDAWMKKHGPIPVAQERSIRNTQQNAEISAERMKATADGKAAIKELQRATQMDNVMDGVNKFITNKWHLLDGYWDTTDSGKDVYVEVKQQMKEINRAIINIINNDANLDEPAKLMNKLNFAENTGQVVGEFQRLLEAGVIHSTPDKLQGDQPIEAAEKALELYLTMHSRNTATAYRHLKGEKRSLEFYEAARIFRSSGMNPVDSLQSAYQIVQKLDPERNALQIEDMDLVIKEVKELGDLYEWWQFDKPNDEDPVNVWQVAGLAKEMINLYIRTGLSKELATRTTLDGLSDRYTLIHGYLVPTWDSAIPDDFSTLAEAKLQQYYDDHADEEELEDVKELFITQVGESPVVFRIMNGNNGLPVEDHADRFITLRDLPVLRKGIEEKAIDVAKKMAIENNKSVLPKELDKRREDELNTISP